VHRDVKPGNVLLAKSGVVKLIDFGIAQRTRGQPAKDVFGAEGVTPSGRIAPEPLGDGFGTPAYMSPEQILGDFVDGRSDLFSLGVVLYQMLSGAKPWDKGEASRGRASTPPLRREAAVSLRERAPEIPRGVERLVMRLLESSPAARHPSAAAVRERLEAALRAETREPPPNLVRAALADAGFVPKVRALSASITSEVEGPQPWPLRRALAGFAAVLVVFLVVVFAVERPSRASAERGARVGRASEPGSGLRVLATPWAHVRVDGADVETTPFARPIPLAPGKHWVQLVHPDSTPVEREIEVGEGQVVTLDVTMPIGVDAGPGGSGNASGATSTKEQP
jgi:eukaryotic-like serine/threonine-protein kinase